MMNVNELSKLLFRRPDSPGWYADFRNVAGYPGLSGRKVKLAPKGKYRATQDRDEALLILKEMVDQVEEGRPSEDPFLSDYVKHHLDLKDVAGEIKESTLIRSESSVRIFVQTMGDVRLSEITVPLLQDFMRKRRAQPGGRGTIKLEKEKERPRISPSTVRNDLNNLSHLCKRAVSEGYLRRNPVSLVMDKPKPRRDREARWLEVDEAVRLLRACKERDVISGPRAVKFLHALVATFLLTGGRLEEVFGLKVSEVDFEHDEVNFRHNEFRKLKKDFHERTIRLWPELKPILRSQIEKLGLKREDLFFPAESGGMLKDIRGSLKSALSLAKVDPTGVNFHSFRHTYATVRLQTLDHGAAVTSFTVAGELGHQGVGELEKRYGHILKRPTRSEGMEYRAGGERDDEA